MTRGEQKKKKREREREREIEREGDFFEREILKERLVREKENGGVICCF